MAIPMMRRILLAWIVVCSSGSLGGTEVVRGPYLQNASPQSVAIKWRTDDLVESIVRLIIGQEYRAAIKGEFAGGFALSFY